MRDLERGFESRDPLGVLARQLAEIALAAEAEELEVLAPADCRADPLDRLEVGEIGMPLVDRSQLELGLVAGVVEVVLLVQLCEEAVGSLAVAVELPLAGDVELAFVGTGSLTQPRIRAVREFTVTTQRRSQLVDITELVKAAAGPLDGAAAALVYVPHTTAGLTINEHADPAVARDFETALERIVSEEWPWQHLEEGEENAPTHIRAAFMGSDVLVPVRDGKLALGTWQGIFFCEFDGPRERSVYVTTLG